MKSSKEKALEAMQVQMITLLQAIDNLNRMEQGKLYKIHVNIEGKCVEVIVAPTTFSKTSFIAFILAFLLTETGISPHFGKIGTIYFKDLMGVENFDKKDAPLLVNYKITNYGKSFLFDK